VSVINYANRVIDFKIVYYGPGMAGKTANLEYIHRSLPNANRGNMISLAAGDDRTIYFDFLPVSALTVRGFQTRFQLYTVPGQVQYDATRRLVLRGADGLVFVADSQFERQRENVESLRNLETNLREYESTLDDIPYVLQYNKRDLPKLAPVTYLEFVLNRRATRVPFFEASAIEGRGVFDTLNTVSRMALASEFGGKREKHDEAS
jgi:mutual gliding-motility protein MglA